jgi:hypothetical protein
MSRTSREEKVQVRKVPNPRLSHPRVQHLREALQQPTQVRKSPTVLKVEEDIRTLLSEKLKRKNIVQEEEGPRGESDIHYLSLEDMEL